MEVLGHELLHGVAVRPGPFDGPEPDIVGDGLVGDGGDQLLGGGAPPQQIVQPPAATPDAMIDRAFRMRRIALDMGDQPFGAAVVRDGMIIGQSWSRVVIDEDPTAHAEMAAIRDASRRLGTRNLGGAILYSSSRPCPMCEAAAYWAGIDRMIFGRIAADAGVPKLCR